MLSLSSPTDSQESRADSASDTNDIVMIDDTPNKIRVVKEMFKDINDNKILCLLSLLYGNIHCVISACLEGLTLKTILHVFRSAEILTKVKKIVVHADSLVRDGICIYKSEKFNIAKPVEIEIVGSDIVDLGGPRK